MNTSTAATPAPTATAIMASAPCASNADCGTAATWWNGESASSQAGAPTSAPSSSQRKQVYWFISVTSSAPW